MLRDILKDDVQVAAVVRVIRHVDPDVLVLGDFDFDLGGIALAALAERLDVYPHRFSRRPNRGLHLGRDLDRDGRLGEPEDAEGYAEYAGQGGMAVLSKHAFDLPALRDFSDLAWKDLPGHIALSDGRNPTRLSTTVHWDLPVVLPGNRRLHLWIWHGTAPVFDGPEDRNGRRNHDETALWLRYLEGDLPVNAPEDFVLLGTANADPFDGESRADALHALLAHPRVQDPKPASVGGEVATAQDGGVNAEHQGPPAMDTADWPDDGPGNLRVDYVLPAAHLPVTGAGVFWPEEAALLGSDVRRASRHRLVWVDIEMGDRLSDRR